MFFTATVNNQICFAVMLVHGQKNHVMTKDEGPNQKSADPVNYGRKTVLLHDAVCEKWMWMGLFSQYIIQYLCISLGNKHISPRPQCCTAYEVREKTYSDGTLEVPHIPICFGFPDWENYRASVATATNVSPHLSPHPLCLLVKNTQRKQSDASLHAWLRVRFRSDMAVIWVSG